MWRCLLGGIAAEGNWDWVLEGVGWVWGESVFCSVSLCANSCALELTSRFDHTWKVSSPCSNGILWEDLILRCLRVKSAARVDESCNQCCANDCSNLKVVCVSGKQGITELFQNRSSFLTQISVSLKLGSFSYCFCYSLNCSVPVGTSQAQKTCPFSEEYRWLWSFGFSSCYRFALPGTCWLLLISGVSFGPSVPVCVFAVRIICSFQECSMKGHALFLFPLGALWDQLPFHFCCIGLLKGCQLGLGKWGLSLLHAAESKYQYVAV